ncbi:MAG: hypothetical protein RMY34_10160 [Aulosira sp. DedQUE10]|nr:hypothetical protein [Aulosira sp. DedQUE10]
MSHCPCCSNLLLLHINGSEIYWFCRHCWQKMPVFMGNQPSLLSEDVLEELPTIVHHSQEYSAKVCTNKCKSINGWLGLNKIPV